MSPELRQDTRHPRVSSFWGVVDGTIDLHVWRCQDTGWKGAIFYMVSKPKGEPLTEDDKARVEAKIADGSLAAEYDGMLTVEEAEIKALDNDAAIARAELDG